MQTISDLHTDLALAICRATAAYNQLAASIEALPGAVDVTPSKASNGERKPKARKAKSQSTATEKSLNGRFPVEDVPGAGF